MDIGSLTGSITLDDAMSGVLLKIDAAMKRFESSTTQSMAGVKESMFSAATVGSFLGNTLSNMALQAVSWAKNLITSSLMAGARLEQLGVSSRFLGEQAGYSSGDIDKLAKEIEATGISGIATRESIVQLLSAHIDLAKAAKLSEIAQNMQSISGRSSSEVFQIMTRALATGNTEILRNIGFQNISIDALTRSSNAVSGHTGSITGAARTQLLMNAILKEGGEKMGLYTESMKTAGKQASSAERAWSQVSEQIGTVLLPITNVAIKSWYKFGETVRDAVTNGGKDISDFVESAAKGLQTLINKTIEYAGLVITKFVEVIQWYRDLSDVTKTLIGWAAKLSLGLWALDAATKAVTASTVLLNNALIINGFRVIPVMSANIANLGLKTGLAATGTMIWVNTLKVLKFGPIIAGIESFVGWLGSLTMTGVMGSVVSGVTAVGGALATFFLSPVVLITAAVVAVVGALRLLTGSFDFIIVPAKQLWQLLTDLWTINMNLWKALRDSLPTWETIKEAINNVADVLVDVIDPTGLVREGFENLQELAKDFSLKTMRDELQRVWDLFDKWSGNKLAREFIHLLAVGTGKVELPTPVGSVKQNPAWFIDPKVAAVLYPSDGPDRKKTGSGAGAGFDAAEVKSAIDTYAQAGVQLAATKLAEQLAMIGGAAKLSGDGLAKMSEEALKLMQSGASLNGELKKLAEQGLAASTLDYEHQEWLRWVADQEKKSDIEFAGKVEKETWDKEASDAAIESYGIEHNAWKSYQEQQADLEEAGKMHTFQLEDEVADNIHRKTMSSTAYRIQKVHDWAKAQEFAFKGTAEQHKIFADKVRTEEDRLVNDIKHDWKGAVTEIADALGDMFAGINSGFGQAMHIMASGLKAMTAEGVKGITQVVVGLQTLASMAAAIMGSKAGTKANQTVLGALGGAAAGAGIGFMFGGAVGAAIGAGIGAITGALAGLIGANKKAEQAWRAANAEIKATTESLIKTYGSLDAITKLAHGLDVNLVSAFGGQGVGALEYLNEQAALFKKRMDDLQTALEAYGLSWLDLGQDMKQALQNMSADKLLAQYTLLANAGVDPAKIAKGMSGALSQLIIDAIKSGTQIPAAMRPALESMIKLGLITDAAARAMLGLAEDTMPSLADITAAAERYGLTLDQLGPKVRQLAITETANQIQSDFDLLMKAGVPFENLIQNIRKTVTDSGEDFDSMSKQAQDAYLKAGGTLTSVGVSMDEQVQDLVTNALKYGAELPASMKPFIQTLIDSGELVDENGEALTDITKLSFAADLSEMFQTLMDKLDLLITKITDGVGGALDGVGNTTVNPHVVVHTRTVNDDTNENDDGSDRAREYANGGVVYAAGGAKILNFKSRGTDTVPAMLTPGERVLSVGQNRLFEQGANKAGQTIIIEMDGREVARASVPYIPDEVRRLKVSH